MAFRNLRRAPSKKRDGAPAIQDKKTAEIRFLISAAPDMLAALPAVKKRLDWDDDHGIADSVVDMVLAAIAKADGRAPTTRRRTPCA